MVNQYNQSNYKALEQFKKGGLSAKEVEKMDPFIISGSQVIPVEKCGSVKKEDV